jgi:hypothetical protein
MHLSHNPISTIPPRSILDYAHPSGELFDPLTVPFNAAFATSSDGRMRVGCVLPRTGERNCSAGNRVLEDNIIGGSVAIDPGNASADGVLGRSFGSVIYT